MKMQNQQLMLEWYLLRKENECMKEIFTPGQIKEIKNQGNRQRRDANDNSQGIAMYVLYWERTNAKFLRMETLKLTKLPK